jgi:hypothetical protein
MNFVAFLSGLGICGAAVFLFHMAKKSFTYKRQTETLQMTSIRHLTPGLVLTGGEVVCDEPIKTPYTTTAAAWYNYTATQRKYYERWIQPGDHVYVLGTAVKNPRGPGLNIIKGDRRSPFFVSHDAADLSTGEFRKNIMVLLLVGAGMAILGLLLLLIGLGVVHAQT